MKDEDLYPGSFWIAKGRYSDDSAYLSDKTVVVVLIKSGKVYYTKQLGFINMRLIDGTINFSYIYRLNEGTFLSKFRPYSGLTFWDYSDFDSNKKNYEGWKAGHLLIEIHNMMVETEFLKKLGQGLKI